MYTRMANKIFLFLLTIGIITIIGCTPISTQNTEQQNSNIQKTTQNAETIQVNLDEEFTLHKNQSATLTHEDLTITITDFVYSPCPKGAECFWSGLGVVLEYDHNGEVQKGTNLSQAFGYQTTIVDSDYKTYAKLKITKM